LRRRQTAVFQVLHICDLFAATIDLTCCQELRAASDIKLTGAAMVSLSDTTIQIDKLILVTVIQTKQKQIQHWDDKSGWLTKIQLVS
jgi:hypothetical protein